jgi:hypothetical protein
MSPGKPRYDFIFKLDARIPITRGNLKVIASTHVMKAYNLADKDMVASLLKDMKYIYPPSANVCSVSSSSYCSFIFRANG